MITTTLSAIHQHTTPAVFTSADTINPVLSPRRITGSVAEFIDMCCSASRGYDTVTIEATADGGVQMMFNNREDKKWGALIAYISNYNINA